MAQSEEQKRIAKQSEVDLIESTRKMLGESKWQELSKMIPEIFKDGGMILRKDTLRAFVEGVVFIESMDRKVSDMSFTGLLAMAGGEKNTLVKGVMIAVLLDYRNTYEADLAEKSSRLA